MDFGNAETNQRTFSLQLINNKDIFRHFAGNMSEYMFAKVQLTEDLFNKWVEGGRLGNYGEVNEGEFTFIYDPASPLRLDNITLEPNTKYNVQLDFIMKDSVIIPEDIADQEIHFRELTMEPSETWVNSDDSTGTGSGNGDEVPMEETVYGNVSFNFNIASTKTNPPAQRGSKENGLKASAEDGNFLVFPNPVSKTLSINYTGAIGQEVTISVTDIVGRTVIPLRKVSFEKNRVVTLNTTMLAPGNYIVNIIDSQGTTLNFKVTKAN